MKLSSCSQTNSLLVVLFGLLNKSHATITNVFDEARDQGIFTTLLRSIQDADLEETISGGGEFTFFAPHDVAFDKLEPGSMAFLSRNPTILEAVLLHHVANEAIELKDLSDGDQLTIQTLLDGDTLDLQVSAVGEDAFQYLLDGLAKVNLPDKDVTNGLLQVIDTVLFPNGVEISPSVADVASELNDFSSLLEAVDAAGFGDVLHDEGPWTVFAPTDQAFAAVDNLDEILADTALLTGVLNKHVVPGKFLAADLTDGQTLTTLSNEDLTVSIVGDTIMIDGAQIVVPDVEGSNGVLHGIDNLLPPPEEEQDPTTNEVQRAGEGPGASSATAASTWGMLAATIFVTVFSLSNIML